MGEVAEIIAGQSPPGESYNETETGVPFYQGKTEFGKMFIGIPKKWTTDPRRFAEAGDILISVRAPVGPVNLATQRISIGRGLAAIKPSKDRLIPLYTFYFLKNQEEHIKGNTGAVFASISRGDIEKIQIPLPPLEIQKEIVAEIEGYQKVIDGARAVLDNYHPHIPIHPDWPMVELGKLLEKFGGTVLPETLKDSVTYIGLENVTQATGEICGQTISESPSKIKSMKNIFKPGQILYGKLRPNLNKVWLADRSGICSTDIFVIQPKYQNVICGFYSILLRSEAFNSTVMSFIKGSQLPRIGWSSFASIMIPNPQPEVQQAIVAEIEAEQALVTANRELIKRMEKKIQTTLARIWGEETETAEPVVLP